MSEEIVVGGVSQPRCCLWCRHFHIKEGGPGYSELTPGDDFDMDCKKERWQIDTYNLTTTQYRSYMRTAEGCDDFEVSPDLKQGND